MPEDPHLGPRRSIKSAKVIDNGALIDCLGRKAAIGASAALAW